MNVEKQNLNKRIWWKFILLHLFSFAGYLYLGKPKRFAAIIAILFLILLASFHGLYGLLSNPIIFLILYVISVFLYLALIIDAIYWTIKCGSINYTIKWYNSWAIYTVIILISIGYGLFGEVYSFKNHIAYKNYSIPASSMKPSLLPGDYIVIDQHSYISTIPEYGDVIVFAYPPNPSIDFVMRVVAVPRDTIQIQNGQIFLNGKSVKREINDIDFVEFGNNITQYLELMPNGKKYLTLDLRPNTSADNTPVYTVPDNHYFVMGDNKDNSNDSRFSVGFVQMENIKGRVTGIYFSSDFGRIGNKL